MKAKLKNVMSRTFLTKNIQQVILLAGVGLAFYAGSVMASPAISGKLGLNVAAGFSGGSSAQDKVSNISIKVSCEGGNDTTLCPAANGDAAGSNFVIHQGPFKDALSIDNSSSSTRVANSLTPVANLVVNDNHPKGTLDVPDNGKIKIDYTLTPNNGSPVSGSTTAIISGGAIKAGSSQANGDKDVCRAADSQSSCVVSFSGNKITLTYTR